MNILYLSTSFIGVLFLVWLNILLLGRARSIIDPETLARRLAAEWPGFHAGEAASTRDGAAALMENTADGSVHLAVIRGDSVVTRRLSVSSLHLVRDESSLSLQLADFTLPRVTLDLRDSAAAIRWEHRLSAGRA